MNLITSETGLDSRTRLDFSRATMKQLAATLQLAYSDSEKHNALRSILTARGIKL